MRTFKSFCLSSNKFCAIIENNKTDEFENIIANFFPDGVGESELNEFLNIERDFIFEQLKIK